MRASAILLPYARLCIHAWAILRLRILLACTGLRIRAGASLWPSVLLHDCPDLPCGHLRPKPATKQRDRQRQCAQADRDPAKPASFTVDHIHASVYPIRCGDCHISHRPYSKHSRMVFRNYSEVIWKS